MWQQEGAFYTVGELGLRAAALREQGAALLEAPRKRGRENWRKQQELKTSQQTAVAKKLSFTLTL